MDDDTKSLAIFIIIFLVLIAAGIGLANQNQIMPIVAEAEAGAAIGTGSVIALEKGVALLLKLLLGATVAGVAAAVFAETKKAYRAWKKSAQAGRWQAGPGAKWQTKQTVEPKLTRQDLMLLALSGK